jgi:hemerythrin
MITWEEKYSTGVAELDKQHKNLFQYTNDLGEYVKNNFGSKETTASMMRFLDQYIKVHFNHEETCMHKHLCPAATKNKDAHQKFILQFKATEKKINDENTGDKALKELHYFLEKWLVDHICKIDTQLKTCVH